MAAETGFIIDGDRHEVPSLDTLTLDEAQVLYDYCGLTIEDFVPLLAETDEDRDELEAELANLAERTKNPGFLRALMHIAYQRANPRLSAKRVKEMIGAADLVENRMALLDIPEEDDAVVPPASTSEPEKSSSKNSLENENAPTEQTESSGNLSEKSSDAPEDPDGFTVTGASTTSSPESLEPTLAP